MEPAASSSMFSNFTLFIILALNLASLLFVILKMYKMSRRRGNLVRCKSYIILGILLVVFYSILTPYFLLEN